MSEELSPEESRRKKLQKIVDLGFDPWGHRFDDRDLLKDVRAREDEIRFVAESGESKSLPSETELGDAPFRDWLKEQGKGTLATDRK
jgi:lysyl-tRNA synthetase class 2